MVYFPPEIWYKIKNYEYQMSHSKNIEKIIKYVKFHAFLINDRFSIYQNKYQNKYENQLYLYILHKRHKWKQYYTKNDIYYLCYKILSENKNIKNIKK